MSENSDLRNRKWLTGDELMKRWGIGEHDLLHYILSTELVAHDSAHMPLDWRDIEMDMKTSFRYRGPDWPGIDNLLFSVENLLEVEAELGIRDDSERSLGTKERRELGRLRMEKEKWDLAIKAAVDATLFCRRRQGVKIKRKELFEELNKFELPESTLEFIWRALREKGFTHSGGRPKKKE